MTIRLKDYSMYSETFGQTSTDLLQVLDSQSPQVNCIKSILSKKTTFHILFD